LGSDNLQFTVEIFGADKEDETESDAVKVISGECFPFLDMEMYWKDENLKFCVHLKENQEVKYLNKGSARTPATYKAIYTGIEGQFAKLTTLDNDTKDVPLDILYPEHAKALKIAGLAPSTYRMLGEIMNCKNDINAKSEKKEKKKRIYARQSFFCVGYHKALTTPIFAVIQIFFNKHNLKWLLV